MDLYAPLLEKFLFPVFEAARGRPTVPLLQFLRGSEHWSIDALRDLQAGLLRRLIRHAATHTSYYRELLDDRGMHADDFRAPSDLLHLPLLDRDLVQATLEARTALEPRAVVHQAGSPSAGTPVATKHNAESEHWRDATRWRGHGWAGYRIGMRALHYWGEPPPAGWLSRRKLAAGHKLTRDLYIDCVVRSEAAMARTVTELTQWKPQVIIAYAAGAGALARFVNDNALRRWGDIPVIIGAERLWPHDRNQITAAFGPVFETYGGRDGLLIGAECEVHDGMHTSMESLIVELIVREPGGRVRTARPGEVGEVAITDLHNLACPMIRYVTGDVAIARPETRCPCGRGLATIGPIDGRVTDAWHRSADEIPLTSAGKRNLVVVPSTAGRPPMLA
jgi:phenylacetate-CoA ligase